MKRVAILFLFVVVVLLLGGYIFSRWFFNQPCAPPSKPENVPLSAQWFGGCDGGDWIELVSIQKEKYHFKIYRDWDGVLKLDAEFEIKGCDNLELNPSNFTKIIAYYNVGVNDEIRLEVRSENRDCHLGMISPAYGGEDWEVIREKGEYQ